ncbi:DNA polymerase alpha/epsilon subunit B-domain-containing protein [Dipodascopsis uninucleata]
MAPSASSSDLNPEALLSLPDESESFPTFDRKKVKSDLISEYNDAFFVSKQNRSYIQQYASIYFLRLAILRSHVAKQAEDAWKNMKIGNEPVKRVNRVLDVHQGEFCWLIGTVYMEMPFKPNILDEMSKDIWVSTAVTSEKYVKDDRGQIMLEDESGRLNLVGYTINSAVFVTGCIIAVLGSETEQGDFEVVDIQFPEMAPQIPRTLSTNVLARRKIALISGLEISGDIHESYQTSMLIEYLMGELGGPNNQEDASEIVQVIIAGNSFGSPHLDLNMSTSDKKAVKRYGYDSSSYNPKPTASLDTIIADLAMSVNVDIMPGECDPSNRTLPQKPLHKALLENSRKYIGSGLRCVSNPCWWDIDGLRILGTSGQPIEDIYKYMTEGNDDRLKLLGYTLRWQHCAPTAPDTLWCYPFKNHDPFIMQETPHLYFAGNQPSFDTMMMEGPDKQQIRLVCVPKFSETSKIVLVDIDSLECSVIDFNIYKKP